MNTYKEEYLFNGWTYCDAVVNSDNEIIASAQPFYTSPDGVVVCDPSVDGYDDDNDEWTETVTGCFVFSDDDDGEPMEFESEDAAKEYMKETYCK